MLLYIQKIVYYMLNNYYTIKKKSTEKALMYESIYNT